MKNKKLAIILLIILFIVLLVAGVIYLQKEKVNTSDRISNYNNISEIEDPISEETEQEVVHNLQLNIISPEENIIIPGQARKYSALAEGNGKYDASVRCNWKFYLNENNEEVLYQGMNNTGILAGESKEICTFTSTFIDRVGTLRIALEMSVHNPAGNVLEAVSAEREYVVQR